MAVPAALYYLVIPHGRWDHGWGVPMATDTAFAVALIVMLGRRVPVELRVFLTAAAIVDDLGSIVVVALFYSSKLQPAYLAGAAAIPAALIAAQSLRCLSRLAVRVSRASRCGHASTRADCTATLAGVILALVIPTRPPPNLEALMAQANAVFTAEMRRGEDVLRHGPSATGIARASTRSTTASNRRPTARCARSSRGRASSCCRCSHWRTRASRSPAA